MFGVVADKVVLSGFSNNRYGVGAVTQVTERGILGGSGRGAALHAEERGDDREHARPESAGSKPGRGGS
jgi:hypothetical protein